MPAVSRYVLCYDPTILSSVKHAMDRNHNHARAKCGLSLSPMRHHRLVNHGEITCGDCLMAVAEEIATEAHAGQYDMDGRLHIEHVRRVVRSSWLGDQDVSAQEMAVRWLHDVFEDSNMTPHVARESFIPQVVVEAVFIISWRKEVEERSHYISRIVQAQGPEGRMAQRTKLVDLDENISRSEHGSTRRNNYIGEYARIAAALGLPDYREAVAV